VPVDVGVLVGATAVIAVAGWRLAAVADAIADRTGIGEALTGAVLLGATTSLPGITASVTAAASGHAQLALSNAVGGITAQTMFLAIADIAHREANLEHAAASPTNILQAGLLIALLAIILLAMLGPDVDVLGIHPATVLLFGGYLFGLRIARRTRKDPMWQPRRTRETREDQPDDQSFRGPSTPALFVRLAVLGAIVGVAGWAVARAGLGLAEGTGLDESIVGGFLTAISTSLPELLVAVAAVRQGALTLAVGGVLGGNAFDTLFAAASDVAYRPGSIYAAASPREAFHVGLGILLSSLLVMGLVRRERRGIANIGFESFSILVLYGLGMLTLVAM